MTGVVVCATTLKLPEPAQLVVPSVAVAVMLMEYPVPAGMPPITAESVVPFVRSIEPDFVKPPGPVMT